jgi:LysR family glycine cleavage system transcriptional activator
MFVCAARHLSFTGAARELHVTQSAVSHQIRDLEARLGVKLFRKSGRSIMLTTLGDSYAKSIANAFDTIASETIRILNVRRPNALHVGAQSSLVSGWILPRLGRFRAAVPGTEIRFITIRQETLPLSSPDVDLELRYGDGCWPEFSTRRIMGERIFPVCSPKLLSKGMPLSRLSDLKYHLLLHDTLNIDWQSWLSHFGVVDVGPDERLSFTHSDVLIQACVKGDSVALGREALVREALRSGILIRPFKESIESTYDYYAVCRREDAERPHIKAFVRWLIEEAA